MPQSEPRARAGDGVLLAIGAGSFMSTLGASAVQVTLPMIRADLGARLSTIEWVITVYLLVVSSLLLTFGRLGDLKGQRRTYRYGLGIFLLGSLLCSLAPTSGVLIACRAVQAVGAAVLFASAPAILTRAFPPERRGRVLGLQGMMTYLGLTLGPALGGWLSQRLGWRAVFLVYLPIGLITLVLAIRYLPLDRDEPVPARFDPWGTATFGLGLSLIILGLNRGSLWGWSSPATLAALSVGAALLARFFQIEKRLESPMLDLSLFRSRIFTAAAASASANYIAVFAVTFLMPFYLIEVRGLAPGTVGLFLMAPPVIMAASSPIAGHLSDRIGSRIPATAGMLVLAVGLLLLSQLGADGPLPLVLVALAVNGLGNGIFAAPNSSSLLGAAPRERQGTASGILATSRNLGMVLGVALSGAITSGMIARSQDPTRGMLDGMRVSYLVAAAIALLGAFISSRRGDSLPPGAAPRR